MQRVTTGYGTARKDARAEGRGYFTRVSASLTERVAVALANLGSTERDAADTLRTLRVTGARGCAEGCVLASYLKRKGLDVSVELSLIPVRSVVVTSEEDEVALPLHLHVLAANFDNGKYPELEAEQ